MFTTLIIFQVLVAAGLISIVLVQRGPGATMGAAFGSGASGTVFGSRGAGNFLTRTTGWLAVGFFGISLALAVLATSLSSQGADESVLSGSVVDQQEQPVEADSGTMMESAIDDLDSPESEQQAGAADVAEQPEEGAAGDASQDEDGTLPEPPPGS